MPYIIYLYALCKAYLDIYMVIKISIKKIDVIHIIRIEYHLINS